MFIIFYGMYFSRSKIIYLILCFNGSFLNAEDTFHKNYKYNEGISYAPSVLRTSLESKGFALTGYLASLMEYSYVVSYHYKESGRLFCSGSIISPHWTISVPNCFRIPMYYYRNREMHHVREQDVNECPCGSSKTDSLTVKPRKYSKKGLREIKKIITLKPENVVVLTVFDKPYIPCESEYARTGSEIVVHSSYKTISHTAEIALLKVAHSLTNDFDIKIPNIGPISVEGDEPALCRVAGYGTLKLNRTFYSHPVLSVIDVEVFAPNVCQTISKTYNATINADPSNYVCSYNRKYRYGSPFSQGDSGAPLICGGNIVGLSQWVFSPVPGYLTFGPSQPIPHVYTKLAVYLPWILNHTKKTYDNKVEIVIKSEEVYTSVVSSEFDSRTVLLIMVFRYLYEICCYKL